MTAMVNFMAQQFQAQNIAPPMPAQRRHRALGRDRDRDEDPLPRTRIKTRDPDPYDGNDPSKLRAFISQCKLVFRARPDDFDDDEVKITYAVSWLKGTAQRWYEPTLALEDDQLPDFALRWDAFEDALKTTFGEPDPVNSATHRLDNLRMLDHHHITKYNVEFNEYSTITGFDERALFAKYYKGLAPRIKDGLVYSGRPDTLAELRTRAMNLDLRYWERRDEEKYRSAAVPSSSTPPSGSPSTPPSKSSRSQSAQPKSVSRSSTPSAPSSSKNDLSKILGPDGKLLPSEKERRRKNNLCMICGSKDHFSDKCDHRKDSASGRVATIDEDSASSAAEETSSDIPN